MSTCGSRDGHGAPHPRLGVPSPGSQDGIHLRETAGKLLPCGPGRKITGVGIGISRENVKEIQDQLRTSLACPQGGSRKAPRLRDTPCEALGPFLRPPPRQCQDRALPRLPTPLPGGDKQLKLALLKCRGEIRRHIALQVIREACPRQIQRGHRSPGGASKCRSRKTEGQKKVR